MDPFRHSLFRSPEVRVNAYRFADLNPAAALLADLPPQRRCGVFSKLYPVARRR